MNPQEKQEFNRMISEVESLKQTVNNLQKMWDAFYRMNLVDRLLLTKNLEMRNADIKMYGRIMANKGDDIVAANDLALGKLGNSFTVTGNTTINAIFVGTWQKGSEVTLVFSGTPTVKHNTAGSAGTAVILLAGAVDFSATANDILSLYFDGIKWMEKCRTVI